jgi:signal transduction histidine kinase
LESLTLQATTNIGKILFVHSVPQLSSALSELWQENPLYTGTVCHSLVNAAHLLESESFQVITVDPFLDGYTPEELLAFLNEKAPDIPILLLVAADRLMDLALLPTNYSEHYVVKETANPLRLHQAIQSLLRAIKLQRRLKHLEKSASSETPEFEAFKHISGSIGKRLSIDAKTLHDMSRGFQQSFSQPLPTLDRDDSDLELVDTQVLLIELLDRRQAMADINDVRIIAEISDNMPPVRLNRKAFIETFGRMVALCLQLSSAGSSISFYARCDGRILTIRLVCEGPGIPDEDVISFFESTWAHEPKKRYFCRTALGLYLSKRLTQLTGATVECISSPTQGVTVELMLPVVTEDEENSLNP